METTTLRPINHSKLLESLAALRAQEDFTKSLGPTLISFLSDLWAHACVGYSAQNPITEIQDNGDTVRFFIDDFEVFFVTIKRAFKFDSDNWFTFRTGYSGGSFSEQYLPLIQGLGALAYNSYKEAILPEMGSEQFRQECENVCKHIFVSLQVQAGGFISFLHNCRDLELAPRSLVYTYTLLVNSRNILDLSRILEWSRENVIDRTTKCVASGRLVGLVGGIDIDVGVMSSIGDLGGQHFQREYRIAFGNNCETQHAFFPGGEDESLLKILEKTYRALALEVSP